MTKLFIFYNSEYYYLSNGFYAIQNQNKYLFYEPLSGEGVCYGNTQL